MKVAISCDGSAVSAHFGRCEKYILFEAENGKLKEKTEVPNPGHKPFFLPKFLSEKGVEKMICQGIGQRAMNLFSELGIEVIAGASGNIESVIENFLSGKLKASGSTCNHFH